MNTPTSWPIWFLDFCRVAAQRSKDPLTRTGAVIVKDLHVIATGYNGFVVGVKETDVRWCRPAKYDYVIHAEENAILQAAKLGISIKGATMYTLLKPCKHCALMIAGSGIRQLVYDATFTEAYDLSNPHNPHGFNVGDEILFEAGVIVVPHPVH